MAARSATGIEGPHDLIRFDVAEIEGWLLIACQLIRPHSEGLSGE